MVAKIIDLNKRIHQLRVAEIAQGLIKRTTKLMHDAPPLLLTQAVLQTIKEKGHSLDVLAELHIMIEIIKIVSYDYYVSMAVHPDYEMVVNTLTKYITEKNKKNET